MTDTTKAALRVPHVSLSVADIWKGERRLEGETYLTPGFLVRQKVQAATNGYCLLGDLVDVWQPSRLAAITVSREHGVPFFAATQVFDLQPIARKFLASKRIRKIDELYVEPGLILVTRSGSVGDTIIAGAAHAGVVISDDLLRVKPKDDETWGFIYAFLRTRFGRAMLRSSKYGSIIKHLEPHHLAGVPVPNVAARLLQALNKQVEELVALRREAFLLMTEAERLYAAAVGEVDGTADETFTVSADELSNGRRRLDGYAHNRFADKIVAHLAKAGKVEPLSSLSCRIFGVPRFKHVYKPTGIPYLDSEDLFKLNPELTKFIPKGAKKNADDYFVKRGWLLMASSGQIYGINGRIVLATEWHEQKIISNHVVRIVPRKGEGMPRVGYLAMALGHPELGRPLLMRLAFGSEVPEITPEDLSDVPILRLSQGIEEQIGERVERASQLYCQADQNENTMVELVEDIVGSLVDIVPSDLPG